MRPAFLAGILAGGGAAAPLRFASPTNRISADYQGLGAANMLGRQVHYVGAGSNKSELRVMVRNWTLSNAGATVNTDAVTVLVCYLTRYADGSFTQVKFSGAGSWTMPANSLADYVSDAILPSAFGLSTFSPSDRFDLTWEIQMASGSFPGDTSATLAGFPWAVYYNPATCIYTDAQKQAAGPVGFPSSGAVSGASIPLSAQLLGRSVTGDPGVFLGTGDSIMANTGATSAPAAGGGGFFPRSLFPADLVSTGGAAGCNIGVGGGTSAFWTVNAPTTAALLSIATYANRFIEEYGINNFGPGAVAPSQAIWTMLRANSATPIKIARTSLLCYTTDATGVTPVANAGVGGTLDSFNNSMAALVGGGIDAYINCRLGIVVNTTPGTAGYFQWLGGNTTVEGLHPNELGHTDVAAAGVRAWIQANI